MENALPVRILERVGDRRADRPHLVERQRPVRSRASSVPPGHELHHEQVVISLGIEVEDRRDPGCDSRESVSASRRKRSPGVAVRRPDGAAQEHLDGDGAVEPGVVRLPDLAHPAGADALDQPVPANEVFMAADPGYLIATITIVVSRLVPLCSSIRAPRRGG